MTTTTSHQIPGAIDDEARNTVPAVRPLVALLAAASAAVVLGVGYLVTQPASVEPPPAQTSVNVDYRTPVERPATQASANVDYRTPIERPAAQTTPATQSAAGGELLGTNECAFWCD